MNFEPKGIRFWDQRTKRNMLLVQGSEWDGWLCYKHPDGEWVSLRKATADDLKKLQLRGVITL